MREPRYNDFVKLTDDKQFIHGNRRITLYKGEIGKVLRENNDGSLFVAFGGDKGSHDLSPFDVEVAR